MQPVEAILALECSSDYGSVALGLTDGRSSVAEFTQRRSHVRQLMPFVERLFARDW